MIKRFRGCCCTARMQQVWAVTFTSRGSVRFCATGQILRVVFCDPKWFKSRWGSLSTAWPRLYVTVGYIVKEFVSVVAIKTPNCNLDSGRVCSLQNWRIHKTSTVTGWQLGVPSVNHTTWKRCFWSQSLFWIHPYILLRSLWLFPIFKSKKQADGLLI